MSTHTYPVIFKNSECDNLATTIIVSIRREAGASTCLKIIFNFTFNIIASQTNLVNANKKIIILKINVIKLYTYNDRLKHLYETFSQYLVLLTV